MRYRAALMEARCARISVVPPHSPRSSARLPSYPRRGTSLGDTSSSKLLTQLLSHEGSCFLERQRLGLSTELMSVERRVLTSYCEELFVAALLDDASSINDENAVRRPNRRKPVRNDDADATREQRFDSALYSAFRFCIQRRRCFVQN